MSVFICIHNGKMVGHLISEVGLVHTREKIFYVCGVDIEVEYAAFVGEVVRVFRIVKNLIVALIFRQIASVFEFGQRGGNLSRVW